MKKFLINENDANQTVFKFLKKVYGTTPLSVIYKWFRKKEIKLNNQRISDKGIILKVNDELIVFDSNQTEQRAVIENVDFRSLEVVYEDENILIANKPFNVEVHSEFNDSLDQMVRAYLFANNAYDPQTENSFVVSHVHRLDKLTSGLVIYAKNKVALDALLTAIQTPDQIEKFYLLQTKPNFPQTLVAKGWMNYDQNLKKSVYKDKIVSSERNYKPALTTFRLLESHETYSLVEAQLFTGRKHQIRASLSFYGFPIINDFKYGGKKLNRERMIFLKAYKLHFKQLPAPLTYLNDLEIVISTSFD